MIVFFSLFTFKNNNNQFDGKIYDLKCVSIYCSVLQYIKKIFKPLNEKQQTKNIKLHTNGCDHSFKTSESENSTHNKQFAMFNAQAINLIIFLLNFLKTFVQFHFNRRRHHHFEIDAFASSHLNRTFSIRMYWIRFGKCSTDFACAFLWIPLNSLFFFCSTRIMSFLFNFRFFVCSKWLGFYARYSKLSEFVVFFYIISFFSVCIFKCMCVCMNWTN